MMKISKRASVTLSLVITILFFTVLFLLAFNLPWLVKVLVDMRDNPHVPADAGWVYGVVLAISYGILAAAAGASGFLFRLLLLVRKGRVFTVQSIACLRGVAWCCIGAGVLFLALGWYFYLSLMVGFVALFVGQCLRVMKNVVEEATEIKSENDLTV